MRRVVLFLATNAAVLVMLEVSMRVLGLDEWLYRQGIPSAGLLVMAAVFGMGGAFVSLAMSKWVAKMSTGARVIETPRTPAEAWLVDTVARLARQAGIGMPEVAIYDSPDMNAFATGMSRDNALVAVSSGLLLGMERDEIEAVLAHEVSHIANGDMVTLTLLQGVLNTFVIFLSRVAGILIDRAVFRSRGYGPGYWIGTIVAEIVLGVLATIIVMWFSRWREFRADAGAARLVGPAPMIAALQRLKASVEHEHLPSELAAFAISGRWGAGLARLFMSHPPLDERIAALERMARQGLAA